MNIDRFKSILINHKISPGMDLISSKSYKDLLEEVEQEMGIDMAEYCTALFHPQGEVSSQRFTTNYRFLPASWEELEKAMSQ